MDAITVTPRGSMIDGSCYGRNEIDLDCLIQAIVGYYGCEGLNKILNEHDELFDYIREEKRMPLPAPPEVTE